MHFLLIFFFSTKLIQLFRAYMRNTVDFTFVEPFRLKLKKYNQTPQRPVGVAVLDFNSFPLLLSVTGKNLLIDFWKLNLFQTIKILWEQILHKSKRKQQ